MGAARFFSTVYGPNNYAGFTATVEEIRFGASPENLRHYQVRNEVIRLDGGDDIASNRAAKRLYGEDGDDTFYVEAGIHRPMNSFGFYYDEPITETAYFGGNGLDTAVTLTSTETCRSRSQATM